MENLSQVRGSLGHAAEESPWPKQGWRQQSHSVTRGRSTGRGESAGKRNVEDYLLEGPISEQRPSPKPQGFPYDVS